MPMGKQPVLKGARMRRLQLWRGYGEGSPEPGEAEAVSESERRLCDEDRLEWRDHR